MKKLLLLGTVLATTILGVQAQSPYGTQVGLTYYDLPSNVSGVNRVVYNEDDQSVSVTWIQSITALAQPTFERGAGYNHMSGGVWQFGTDGACRVNNACTQEYSGWPEIINFPKQDVTLNGVTYTDVSTEVILAHSDGLKTISRGYRAAGNWDPVQKILVDQDYCAAGSQGTWPRAVSQGDKYIHAIATQVGTDLGATLTCGVHSSVDRPFLYYRSSDQGQTWDIQNAVLTGLEDTTFYTAGRGDEYAIAANGDVVAVIAGGNDEPWVMWKSRDKGLTWDYTIIRDWDPKVVFQKGFFNTGEDGKETSDGSHAVVIDDNGVVHCFTGVVINAVDPVTGEWTGQATFGNSGIWYWNDDMTDFCEPAYIADAVDYGSLDGSGNFVPHASPKYASVDSDWDAFDAMAPENGGYFASSTTMPSASVDANGNIYLTYSSDVEGTAYGASTPSDAAAIPFKDIFMVWSNDGGVTWSKELNLASDLAGYDDGSGGSGIEEDVFPTVAHKVGTDRILHVMWNMDYKPGSDVRDDNGEFSQQYLSYYGVDLSTLTMDAGVTVTATPNTISAIADTSMATGGEYVADIAEGFYATMNPYTAYNVPDTAWCLECDSSTIASIDSIWCIGCGAGGIDTLSGLDTAYTDTVSSIGAMDLNAGTDSLFSITSDVSGVYSFTAVYGNACADPSTTFTLTSTGGAVTANVIDDSIVTICAGESVTLTGVAGGGSGTYSLLWDDAGASTTSSITVTPATTTTYIFDVDGGAAQDSVQVVVNALPAAVDAGADVTLTLELDANNECTTPFTALGNAGSAGFSYLWSPQVGMTADDAMTADPTVLPTVTTTYTLTTTEDATGCVSSDQIVVTVTGNCVPVGVIEDLKFELAVYPNPAKNMVNVEVGNAVINAVTVYNNLGAIVSKEVVSGKTLHQINTTNYSNGIYYIYVQTNEGETTKQISIVD